MPTQRDFLVDDILGDGRDNLETDAMPAQRSIRLTPRRKFQRIQQRQALNEVIGEPPAVGESIHVLSAAKFDYWTWVPAMVDWLGRADELYCSTWTLSRQNAVEMFELWDTGKVQPGKVAFLTGLYFKRRETAVYSMLLAGIRERGGRYRAFLNHAKVLLLCNAAQRHYLTIEGSANLTSNPRVEQSVITNDQALYNFHRAWFEEMLKTGPAEKE